MCVREELQREILTTLQNTKNQYNQEGIRKKISNNHSKKLLRAMLDKLTKAAQKM